MLYSLIQWNQLSLKVLSILFIICTHKTVLSIDPIYQINYEAFTNRIEFSVGNENYTLQEVICKSVYGVYNGTNSCEDLDPCVTYFVTLAIIPVEDDGENNLIDQTFDVNTTYATPHVQNLRAIPDQFSMSIHWDVSVRTCIYTLAITVSAPGQTFTNELQNDKDSVDIDNLNPCQTHIIQVKIKDFQGNFVGDPIQTNATTEYAEPDDVTNIKFEDVEKEAVKVTWEPPKYSSCINTLFLKWSTMECIEEMKTKGFFHPNKNDKDEGCKWNEKSITDQIANTKEYTIENLDGCEEYGLIFYMNDISKPKSNLTTFTLPEQLPGLIAYGDHKINSTSVTVVWKFPKQNKKCVDVYKVQLIGPIQKDPQFYEQFSKEPIAEFDNLDPCGKYNISVQPFGHNGLPGIQINSSLELQEDNPTKVRNVKIRAKAKELYLHWEPPEFADLCLEGYRVSAYDEPDNSIFNKEINETEVVINENLVSCQVYTVQIIPYTKSREKDGLPESVEQITAPMVAAPPNPFQSTLRQSHSIELSARDNDYKTNKCQTLFARFVCETTKNVPYTSVTKYVEGSLGDVSFKAAMSPLSPFTEYVCKVDLFNTAGWSNYTQAIFSTDKYYPETPSNVSVKSIAINQIRFQWNLPVYPNGNINVYRFYFRLMQPAYYIPPNCKLPPSEPINLETSSLEYGFPTLPYTYYSFQVAAQNEFGAGEYTLPMMERSLPSVSEPLTYFKVISISGPDVNSTTFKANVSINWQMPCFSNGEIEEFVLEFEGKRESYESVSFVRRVEPVYDGTGLMTFNETELQPEYDYNVLISVKNKDVLEKSPAKLLTFQSPAGIPDKIEDISAAKVDAFEASNPTTSAVVRFSVDILNSDSGTILYAALLLSQKNCNPEPKLEIGALDSNNEWPNTSSWSDTTQNSDCIQQYQTTPVRWQPIQPRSGNIIEYTIGAESCNNNTNKRYCNGPLKPDTEYTMVIRLFTKSSFSDAGVLVFKTDSLIKLALIWISIISCLMVAFIAGFLYLYITKKIIWHRESGHGIEDSFGDITTKNFAIFYNDLSKRDKLQREFKELTIIATDLSFSASETNEYKNRYRDIFPYDKNRVILDIDADGCDYINASFINGYRRKKEYIAAQGPKQESIVDFWRMVIQHNVKIIVMVTQFKEEDKIKCHHYYPYEWKNIKVEIQKEESFDLYDRREMIVTHAQQHIRRKIVHFYFKMWPDHGVPKDPTSLITFVRKVKAEKCPSDSPIVVHCSAGVGRTGTFIGLDIIMQRIKSESKINIFETVKGLRFQRMKMVQSMQQYSFLYSCAFELVKHKRGKYVLKNKKKVSFENDQDTDLGTMPKVSIMDVDGEKDYETKDFESVI